MNKNQFVHFHLSFLHPLGATNADKAILLKKWVDEVMLIKAEVKPSCLVRDPITGARMYGLFRGLQDWNINKFEAHITLFTRHTCELMETGQSWGTYTRVSGGEAGGVSSYEINLGFFWG